MFIRHQRSENSPFTKKTSSANVWYPVTIFYSDKEPLSKYSPVMLHLSTVTRILNENPDEVTSLRDGHLGKMDITLRPEVSIFERVDSSGKCP